MKKIIQYFKRRKVRKLAERILAFQIVYNNRQNQHTMICAAIDTAKRFYEEWEKRK